MSARTLLTRLRRFSILETLHLRPPAAPSSYVSSDDVWRDHFVLMRLHVKEWKGAWWVCINHRGQRRAKRYASKKAAVLAADKIDAALRLGQTEVLEAERGRTPTVAEYADTWLGTLGGRVRQSTAEEYETRLRIRVLPLIGHLPLTAITRARVRACVADGRQGESTHHGTATGVARDD